MYGLKPGDTQVTMPRGAIESTSMFSSVIVKGAEITVQRVPHHRIFGMYLQGRSTTWDMMFAGNAENEMLCMLDKIPFDYIPKKKWTNTPLNYTPKPIIPTGNLAKVNFNKIDFSQFSHFKQITDWKASFTFWDPIDLQVFSNNAGLDNNEILLYGPLDQKDTYYKLFNDIKLLLP